MSSTTPTQATSTKSGKHQVTDEHKAALAAGRQRSHTVDSYLNVISNQKPSRGRPVDPAKLKARVAELEQKLPTLGPLQRLLVTQQIEDANERLKSLDSSGEEDISALQAAFIEIAADYSNSKGLTRSAWRAVGVPAKVLDEAGIK